MKKRLPLLLFPVLALILEALPYGAVLQFARPAAAPLRELYSYFDLTPFGYANFAPLFTALGTCVLLVLLALYAGTGKRGLAAAAHQRAQNGSDVRAVEAAGELAIREGPRAALAEKHVALGVHPAARLQARHILRTRLHGAAPFHDDGPRAAHGQRQRTEKPRRAGANHQRPRLA